MGSELVDRAIEDLRRLWNARRAAAYRACLTGDDGRPTPQGERMLADLRNFCRGNASTFDPDPRIHALLEGRREVLLRIINFLNVDSAELAKLVEVKDE